MTYDACEFSAYVLREIFGVVKVKISGSKVLVNIDNGAVKIFDINNSVSGLSVENLKYAVVSPEMFKFYIVLDTNVLHIFCPCVYGGAFDDCVKLV